MSRFPEPFRQVGIWPYRLIESGQQGATPLAEFLDGGRIPAAHLDPERDDDGPDLEFDSAPIPEHASPLRGTPHRKGRAAI